MSFLENDFFLLAVTFGIFLLRQTTPEENRTGIAKPDITYNRSAYYFS